MRFAILSAFAALLLAGLVHAVPVEDVNPVPIPDEEAIPDAAGSGWFSNSSENQTKFQVMRPNFEIFLQGLLHTLNDSK